MNKTFSYILTFSAGVAIGVAASWKLLKDHYEKITQEEIDSFYDSLSPSKNHEEETHETEVNEVVVAKKEYADVLTATGYAGKEITDEEVSDVRPKVISDSEFAALDENEYDIITLTYYADGILSDDRDDIIYDIDDIIGEDSLEAFKDVDERGNPVDTIYVVNDELGTAYEILRDNREYESVTRKLYRGSHLDNDT